MMMEELVKLLVGETKVVEENLTQRNFVHH
jgi:hypothetical protein